MAEDHLKKSLHDLMIDKQIGHPLEIFKILVVRLLGGIENLLNKDHNSIKEILVLDPSEHLLDCMLDYPSLQSLVGVDPCLILRGQ